MAKDAKKKTSKMRKTVVFSKKNADVFEKLTEMQGKNENISEYLCELVRRDLNPVQDDIVNKEEFNNLNNKVDAIMDLLMDIKNNNLVVQVVDEVEKEEEETIEAKFEYLTEDDVQKEELSSQDVDDFNMFG